MNVTDGMRKVVETLIEEWKTDSDVVLWEDERPLEGFLQKHVLPHDPEREVRCA